MIRLVLLFFLFVNTSYSKVDKAEGYFKDKKYKESSEIFYDRYLAKPFDNKNTFNLGLSLYYQKSLEQSLIYFKKVAGSNSSLKPVAFFFMAKIFYDLKKYKSSIATLGKAMSFKNTPEPIFMSMMDLWELLNTKKFNFNQKGKELLNTIDVESYLNKLDSFKNLSLSESEQANLRQALEFFQLAWVLEPIDSVLENIIRCYLILGDEDKAIRLLMLVRDIDTQKNLTQFLSDRKDQISRRELRKSVVYESPNIFEFQFMGGFINDSNPVTRRRIQGTEIKELGRIHVDIGLNMNPYLDNDFVFQFKTRVISDRIKDDPITDENSENNSSLVLSSLEIPAYVLSKSTRLKVSSMFDHYKVNDSTLMTIAGVTLSYEKYFSRYATYFNSWYKVNNGVNLDFYDGQNWGIESGVFRYTRRSYFGLGGGYRKEKAGIFGLEKFSFYEKYLTMRGRRNLTKNLSSEVGISLGLKTFYGLREDEKINLFSTFAFELLPNTFIQARYDFFDNGSTLAEYDFNQHQIGFHLVGDYF
tara:strand:- start:2119 stop:3705 length:1587 start_codon:yes stop_codon:yes gene_type:complete